MTLQPNNHQHFQDSETQTELELLEAIVQADIPYPWNPTQSDTEAYFADLEQEFAASDWLYDADLAHNSQILFTQLDRLWSARALKKSLFDKFTLVPEDLLDKIADSVQQVIVNYQSLAEQMVQSTLEILPQWAEEDLQVLARPLAYAMRNAEQESDVPVVESWEKLSEIEQARMSLAIARYAISQLAAISDENK
ncbi:MAG TPA: hypothetical protein VK211_09460 [Kamptonema sp.]|nr:hypothetical protein [Kamptonema sp.]